MLQNPSRVLEGELQRVRLSPEEVFVEVATVLDYIKQNPREANFVLQGLWDSTFCDLRETDINNSPTDELELAASEVVYAVMLALGLLEGPWYTRLTMSLMQQANRRVQHYDRLQELFMPNLWRYGEDKLQAYLQRYMDSEEEWLSDDMESIIRKATEEAVSESPKYNRERGDKPDVSAVRIAPRKQTSVIVLLEAMYKAGWFEKADGSKATNRDETISEILRRAFNAEKASPTQILQAAKDPIKNKTGIDKYFMELKAAME